MGKSSQHCIGRSLLCAGAAFVAFSVLIHPLAAAPEDEVRATFDQFVAAQNDHDAKAVETLLLELAELPLDHPRHPGVGHRGGHEALRHALSRDMAP